MKTNSLLSEEKFDVPIKEMACYMGGFLGQNLSYNMIASWTFIFFTTIVGLESWICGLILGICKIIDAFTDIVAGALIDKHRFKNGEKLRPFLKLIPIPVGFFAFFLFVDFGFSNIGSAIYLFAVYLLWDIFYSVHDVSLWGMSAVITGSESGRNKVAQWARIACTVGSWLPMLITFFMGSAEKLNITEKDIFIVSGLVFGFGGMLISMTASKTKERVRTATHTYTLREMIKGIGTNKILLYMVIANILSGITIAIPSIYFYKYMVGYDFSLFGLEMNGLNVLAVSGIITAIPGTLMMFIAVKFAKKMGGMKNIILLSCFMNIGVRLLCFAIGYEGWKMILVIILTMIMNIPMSLVAIANTSLWGDAVSYNEYKTGIRNEGLAFACQNLTGKASSGISTIIIGFVLSLIGFSESNYYADLPQNDTFNKWIWALFILGPILGSIFNAIPLLMLKYTEAERHKVEEVIRQNRLNDALLNSTSELE